MPSVFQHTVPCSSFSIILLILVIWALFCALPWPLMCTQCCWLLTVSTAIIPRCCGQRRVRMLLCLLRSISRGRLLRSRWLATFLVTIGAYLLVRGALLCISE